jgi:hypothetical protein
MWETPATPTAGVSADSHSDLNKGFDERKVPSRLTRTAQT